MSSVLHFANFLILNSLLWLTCTLAYSFPQLSNMSIAQGYYISKPGCPNRCGNLTVPFPFGIGVNTGCSLNAFFDINCTKFYDTTRAFIGPDGLEVLAIYDWKILIKNRAGLICFDANKERPDNLLIDEPRTSFNFTGSPFSISAENDLIAVGCDVTAQLTTSPAADEDYGDFVNLCIAMCNNTEDLRNGSCSGIGCCRSSIISKGIQSFYVETGIVTARPSFRFSSPCGYSFLAEKNSYVFYVSDISADPLAVYSIVERYPVVIDWAIGQRNCSEAQNIVCQEHSACDDVDTGLGGYHCKCSQGFKGNPYLSPGCQDINECEFDPCHKEATCINLLGSYDCSCKVGYFGDGRKDGIGCLVHRSVTIILYGLLTGLGSFLALLFGFWIYRILKKRAKTKRKQKYFKQNGGLLLLKQQSCTPDHVLERMKIFTSKELERATDKFNENLILGRGGQGIVYKGMLGDGRTVAIKRSKKLTKDQLDEFINEVFILSQIKHRNIVKLHGCCLETEVPLLVYEYVPNGTLSELINNCSNNPVLLSWEMRLKIAAEVANGLAYLHSATSVPIYHRDMKSTNVLIDAKYSAKISDFGISRSIAIDQTHLTTEVKGTLGYVDPEYFQRGQFTEKSDVYSFGVILVELLTGQKPIFRSESEEVRSLVEHFLLGMEEEQLKTIIDPQITGEVVTEDQLAVAKLAKKCLHLKGERRPDIREVAMELESMRSSQNPSSVESETEDIS